MSDIDHAIYYLETVGLQHDADAVRALRTEVANYRAGDIHTCCDECQRPMCVLRRERDALLTMNGAQAQTIVEMRSEIGSLAEAMQHPSYEVENSLRARVAELEAQVKAARWQEPAFWYLPAEDEDGEDALLLPCRDGSSPAVGALPLYAAPVTPAAAQPVAVPCAGTNCGSTDGWRHSAECFAEHDAASGYKQPAASKKEGE